MISLAFSCVSHLYTLGFSPKTPTDSDSKRILKHEIMAAKSTFPKMTLDHFVFWSHLIFCVHSAETSLHQSRCFIDWWPIEDPVRDYQLLPMQFDYWHWSQENTSGLCVYWCVQLLLQRLSRALEHRLTLRDVCILSLCWMCVCVSERMLGCYCAEGLADFRATVLSVRLYWGVVLWVWKAWCGESDAEEQ